MNLQANITATPYDEDYDMALMYCFDENLDYCFSLTRSADSKYIEIMVSDQITHQVENLKLILSQNLIEIELDRMTARKLDGNRRYSIEFESKGINISDLESTLSKIFENKSGYEKHAH